MTDCGLSKPIARSQFRSSANGPASNDVIMVHSGVAGWDDCAMHVRATVVSGPTDDRAIVDAGSKVLTREQWYMRNFGHVVEYPDAAVVNLSEEHGIIDLSASARKPQVGEVINIVPNPLHLLQHGRRGLRPARWRGRARLACRGTRQGAVTKPIAGPGFEEAGRQPREEDMSSRTKSIVIGLAGVALLSPSAASADKLADVLARGKLIVGTGSTNPPWHFRDEAGNLAGFDVDVAKIVAKGLFDDPEKIEFVTQASDARIPNVVTDKVDITCQFMTVTAARAQLVNFTIPYYREGVGLLLTKGGKHKSL